MKRKIIKHGLDKYAVLMQLFRLDDYHIEKRRRRENGK